MAILFEGQKYALSSATHSANNTLIFVKLTDSALKAIEDYLNNNKSAVTTQSKPSIEFRAKESQGVISLPPLVKSNNADEERQRFSFTLSQVEAEGPQGSFECVRQSRKAMQSLGNMHYKMQINAREDSFQKTKDRMAVAEQESKKNCTKVIKASGPNVGIKVKVKRPQVSSKYVHNLSNTTIVKANSSPPILKTNGITIPNVKSNANIIAQQQTFHISNNISPVSADITTKKPLREHVIHLLALRPYKKCDLLSRLSMDGFKDVDKKELSSLLKRISQLKDASYHLSRNVWNDVNIDWQYYSSDDKEIVRKRMQTHGLHNNISPQSDCGSLKAFSSLNICTNNNNNVSDINNSPISPVNAKRTVESAPMVAKRQKKLTSHKSMNPKCPPNKLQTNGYREVLNGWANKPASPERDANNRVSYLSNANISCTPDLRAADSSQNVSHPSPDSNGICFPQQFSQVLQNSNCVNFVHNDNYSKKSNRDVYRFNVTSTTNCSDSINSSPNSSPDSGTGSHDGSILSSTNSYSCANDDNDYLSKYTKITNNEQRTQYKKDFYREYEEYRRLHMYIAGVAQKFSELEIRLNTKIEGSDEWNRLMDQIVKEYEDTKNSHAFQDARKRLLYLHDKLAHIKGLVMQFDNS